MSNIKVGEQGLYVQRGSLEAMVRFDIRMPIKPLVDITTISGSENEAELALAIGTEVIQFWKKWDKQ